MKWYLLFTYTEAQWHHNGIVEFQEMFVTKTQTQQSLTGWFFGTIFTQHVSVIIVFCISLVENTVT